IFVIVVFAGERELFLGPGALDYFEDFSKALRALAIGNAVGLVGPRKTAAADAENQPSMANVIDGRGVFGPTQWLEQRHEPKRRADLDVLGAGGNRAGDRHRHRAHRTLGRHVNFGQPDGVETPALGGVDLLESS